MNITIKEGNFVKIERDYVRHNFNALAECIIKLSKKEVVL